MLRDTSASYTDIKIYNGNEILFHWVLRGFRSDTDLTVQTQFVDEFLRQGGQQGQAPPVDRGGSLRWLESVGHEL